MTEDQARRVAAELEIFCQKHKIWYSRTDEMKPGLSVIKFSEISIKVTNKKSSTT